MNPILKNNLNTINILCKNHKVSKLFVFGSVLNENYNCESDLDFLVDFQENLEPLEQGRLWWSLYDELRTVFQKEIDLVNQNKVKNPYFFQELQNTKELVYG